MKNCVKQVIYETFFDYCDQIQASEYYGNVLNFVTSCYIESIFENEEENEFRFKVQKAFNFYVSSW